MPSSLNRCSVVETTVETWSWRWDKVRSLEAQSTSRLKSWKSTSVEENLRGEISKQQCRIFQVNYFNAFAIRQQWQVGSSLWNHVACWRSNPRSRSWREKRGGCELYMNLREKRRVAREKGRIHHQLGPLLYQYSWTRKAAGADECAPTGLGFSGPWFCLWNLSSQNLNHLINCHSEPSIASSNKLPRVAASSPAEAVMFNLLDQHHHRV